MIEDSIQYAKELIEDTVDIYHQKIDNLADTISTLQKRVEMLENELRLSNYQTTKRVDDLSLEVRRHHIKLR